MTTARVNVMKIIMEINVKVNPRPSKPVINNDLYRTHAIITCGLYNFYPLFEVHICTVTCVWLVFKSGF